MKLALFDVSDVNNPRQLSNVTIGDRGTDSLALSDPKAFLFDKSKGLLVIPVSLAVVSEADKAQYGVSAYGNTVWQGAYVYGISIDGGFTLKGTVTHLNASITEQSRPHDKHKRLLQQPKPIDHPITLHRQHTLHSLQRRSQTQQPN